MRWSSMPSMRQRRCNGCGGPCSRRQHFASSEISQCRPARLPTGAGPALLARADEVTGISIVQAEMAAKRLEVLHELVPGARNTGFLTNPTNRSIEVVVPDGHRAADTLGLQVIVGNARSQSEFDVAFENFVRYRTQALLVDADAVLFSLRQQIIALAAGHSLPTLYVDRLYVEEGGLISYGASITDAYREAGIYAGKILNGAHPATCRFCNRPSSS